MYKNYFGLAETPFSIAPDPRYLYMSRQHREALAHLRYGINSDGGFVLLTGEVGTGKTTICRCFLEHIPEHCDVAFIFNPKLTAAELLSTICDEWRIAYPEGNTSVKVFVDRINAYLLGAHAKGRRCVLVIDEAQNLSVDVLEQVRLLTNLETNRRKLLQIVLLAQPQLREMLARPELTQLAQRIIARYHLERLSKEEVAAYVTHRLAIAGAKRPLFPPSTVHQLYRLSGGIPRLINVFCDRALLGAYVQGKDNVDRRTLARTAREVLGAAGTWRLGISSRAAFAGMALLGTAVTVAAAYYYYDPRGVAAPTELPGVRREIAAPAPSPPQPEYSAHTAEAPRADHQLVASVEPTTEARAVESLRWPANLERNRSEALAFQALFKQWKLSDQPESGAHACRSAEQSGLRCLSARGGLDELRRLNRPAVLLLQGEDGQNFFATLTRLQDSTATVAIGTESVAVAMPALASRWSGRFTLLWQAPPGYREVIRAGSRGSLVAWLSGQIALAQGRTDDGKANATFGETLLRQVKQFQLAAGLVPDGIVGPQTLIRLETALGGKSPTLIEPQSGG